ncbi:hypothetical protein EDD15DRAFT_23928 [Pisolithus albus]|nr:hypothetical protein EDD15DRAFT_23928 [Pisolithus albus]
MKTTAALQLLPQLHRQLLPITICPIEFAKPSLPLVKYATDSAIAIGDVLVLIALISSMGLLDVNMPMLYGEGKKAFLCPQPGIIRQSSNQTTFAWGPTDETLLTSTVLADDPSLFRKCHDVVQIESKEHYSILLVLLTIVRTPDLYGDRTFFLGVSSFTSSGPLKCKCSIHSPSPIWEYRSRFPLGIIVAIRLFCKWHWPAEGRVIQS